MAEQVLRAANAVVASMTSLQKIREQLYKDEIERQNYHAVRNAQACKSLRKSRCKRLAELGINPDKIKSVPPKNSEETQETSRRWRCPVS